MVTRHTAPMIAVLRPIARTPGGWPDRPHMSQTGSGANLFHEPRPTSPIRPIASASKPEQWVEDKAKESQPQSVGGALAEVVGDVDRQDQKDKQIDERNAQQDQPPAGTAGEFEQQDDIVNGN